jgi:Fe2+ transport system protein FeoA
MASLTAGTRATIRRISEVAEHDARDFLLMLAGHQISEGSVIDVIKSLADHGDVTVMTSGKSVTLPREAARLIWVEVAA